MFKKIIFGASVFAAASFANAAVISFEVDQTFAQGGSSSDLTATTIAIGSASTFTIDPGASGRYFDFKLPGTGTFATVATQINGYYFLDSYAAGDSIGAGTFGSHSSVADDWDTILVNDQTAGVWGSSHDGFLGFLTEGNSYGWLEYSFDRTGSVSTMSFFDGAYNDVAGESIVAGAASSVPEPSTLVLLGLGLAGLGFSRKKQSAK